MTSLSTWASVCSGVPHRLGSRSIAAELAALASSRPVSDQDTATVRFQGHPALGQGSRGPAEG